MHAARGAAGSELMSRNPLITQYKKASTLR
jgi:hypothetical protein